MHTSKSNDDKLLRMTKDLEEIKVGKSQPFYRHLVVHELDFLYILTQMFTSMSNEKKDRGTSDSHVTDINQNKNNIVDKSINSNNNDSSNQKETMNIDVDKSTTPTSSPKGGAVSLKIDDENLKLKKKVKRILGKVTLSNAAKTELVIDLILTSRRRAVLQAQRKFPGGNQKLLGGGSKINNVVKPKMKQVATASSLDQIEHKQQKEKKEEEEEKRRKSKKEKEEEEEEEEEEEDDEEDEEDEEDEDEEEEDEEE